MIIEEHVFNPKYNPKWQERVFFPKSIRKVWNFIKANIHFKLGSIKLSSYPYFALIDPSTVCNLHCPLCPTGQGDTSRPRCLLKFDEFKRIIDKLGDYLISILFTNWGEPLLNKEFFRMVKYAKKVKCVPFVSTATNLNVTLSDKDTEELIESDLNLMCVSIDGTTQKIYEKYRRGGSLKKVIDNSKKILEKRKELGKDNPFVVWQFLVFKHNQHEVEKVIKLAREIGVDAIRIAAAQVYMSEVDKPFEYSYEISKEHLPPLGSRYSAYTKGGKKKNLKKRCNWLWKAVVINSDGGISPCCAIFPKRYDFGNVLNEKNFKAIWNNEKYQNARKAVKNPNYAKKLFREGGGLVCAPCVVYENWI